MLEKFLLNWYDKHRRVFPWREKIFETQDEHAYHTWICEVMSQQTLLSVLLPKYNQFLHELPNVDALYQCSEEKLRFLWKGLGYYARARNLQKGAQYIVQTCQGVFPTSHLGWKCVPGCGDYTAAVIASVCYREPIAAVDGNAIRVASRLLNLQDVSVWARKGQLQIFNFLQSHVSKTRPGDFNQAIMDLGATLCKKHEPNCIQCPIQKYCLAYQNQTVTLCPPVKPRAEKIQQHLYVLIIRHLGTVKKVAILKRSSKFLRHTTGFPIYVTNDIKAFEKSIANVRKMDAKIHEFNKTFKHSITNHNIIGRVVCLDFIDKSNHATQDECDLTLYVRKILYDFGIMSSIQWVDAASLKDLLSSSLDQKAYRIFLSME